MMTKWLTSFVLIAAIGGSAFAGVPLHTKEQACSMTGMMDCCRMAHAQTNTPQVAAARLCCALNCETPGTTTPTTLHTQRVISLLAIAIHPATLLRAPLTPARPARYPGSLPDHPNSQPTYIRHLALLI